MSYESIAAEAYVWAKLQDAAATAVVNTNGTDGVLTGGATTADLSQELSLAPWLLRCQTGATGQYIDFGAVPASLAGANPRTYCLWVRPAAFDTGVNFTFLSAGETGVNKGKNLVASFEDGAVSIGFSGNRTITPKSALSVDTVYHIAIRVPDGASTTADVEVLINGVNQTLTTEAGSPQTLNTGTTGIYVLGWPFGVSAGSEFADFMAIPRALSDAEIVNEVMAGPTGPVAYVTSKQLTTDLSAYTFSGVPIGIADADRGLALAVHSRGANGGVLNSLTVDGVSASKIVGIANSTVGTGSSTNWYAIDKPTGDTSDIVATFASTQLRAVMYVYRLTGIDLATIAGTATSEARSAILSLPARPGGVVLAAGNVAQTGRTPTWAGVTEDATASLEGFFTASSASHIASAYEPSRTVTLDWDTTGVDFAAAAISLRANASVSAVRRPSLVLPFTQSFSKSFAR